MFDEKEILEFWEKNKIFEKSVARRKNKKTFVFFEGPPGANGKPHIGHFETRVFKDIVLRYKTMRGFYVPRRAGWDTHGLPIEVEVEKTLGLKNKKDIEIYGVAAFNKKCRELVWQYKDVWERMTARMGFWIDMQHSYITYENNYIESLWAVIKEFAKKGLLYEDFKVLPWCVRCGTALSSHELAQGYEKVKENSVYVKFQTKNVKIFYLVWTTTPWTLPGNVALAVNPQINYCFAKNNLSEEIFILAESRLGVLGEGYSVIKKVKGSELVGMKYEPPYPPSRKATEDAADYYKIVAADFVSAEDGTGIVHIAPAFGDDDFQVGKKYDLPVLLTVDERGIMQTPEWTWNGAFFSALGGSASGGKKANELIIEDLNARNLLFKEEPYEHDYPFCWRCKTPLMYFARKSWWVDVNKVRRELLENNAAVNWRPEHIKEGRFGEWLKEKKNWAFSRERYWGTPLPVWRCDPPAGGCGKWEAAGSLDEIQKRGTPSKNKYIMMRHGEAITNAKNITNCTLEKNIYPLTPKGRREAARSAGEMKKKKIKPDIIVASPFLRTKETAEKIAEFFEIDKKNIKLDVRLGEINTGIFAEGKPAKYHAFYKSQIEKFEKNPPDGENLNDLKKRAFAVIEEIESQYSDKIVLIVSHEYTLWMLWSAALGKSYEESVAANEGKRDFIATGGWRSLEIPQLPRGENFVLDFHKPYIDSIVLKCPCGGAMKRVPEVCDVWFDSGAMPFASNAPGFPADYIVEAIDQTRGWFYTLLAVSTLLGKGAPYKNVTVLGHVLDKNGKKMSKSLGNIVDPAALIEKYGADSARWYFLTINQPWDSKLFTEDDVKDASRRFFMILWNVLQFHKLYAVSSKPYAGRKAYGVQPMAKLLINQWVLIKLQDTIRVVTEKLDAYDIVGAARDLENFVTEDISRWYIRRIRDVMKENSAGRKETGAVLRYLLMEISKFLAPFAPFISEKIWMELGNKGSVHLENWSILKKLRPLDEKLLKDMDATRRIVGLALEARAKLGIRVRQPLSKLETKTQTLSIFVKEEINVKDVVVNVKLTDEIKLDPAITPELREEGILRDLIREIQSARKTAGLMPKDKASAVLELPKEIFEAAKKYEKVLEEEVNLESMKVSEASVIKILLNK
ncbi:MAG: class I tRNA ligase family protein [bacterium]|nr:class I tRNA ligase family protein [bacterium]